MLNNSDQIGNNYYYVTSYSQLKEYLACCDDKLSQVNLLTPQHQQCCIKTSLFFITPKIIDHLGISLLLYILTPYQQLAHFVFNCQNSLSYGLHIIEHNKYAYLILQLPPQINKQIMQKYQQVHIFNSYQQALHYFTLKT